MFEGREPTINPIENETVSFSEKRINWTKDRQFCLRLPEGGSDHQELSSSNWESIFSVLREETNYEQVKLKVSALFKFLKRSPGLPEAQKDYIGELENIFNEKIQQLEGAAISQELKATSGETDDFYSLLHKKIYADKDIEFVKESTFPLMVEIRDSILTSVNKICRERKIQGIRAHFTSMAQANLLIECSNYLEKSELAVKSSDDVVFQALEQWKSDSDDSLKSRIARYVEENFDAIAREVSVERIKSISAADIPHVGEITEAVAEREETAVAEASGIIERIETEVKTPEVTLTDEVGTNMGDITGAPGEAAEISTSLDTATEKLASEAIEPIGGGDVAIEQAPLGGDNQPVADESAVGPIENNVIKPIVETDSEVQEGAKPASRLTSRRIEDIDTTSSRQSQLKETIVVTEPPADAVAQDLSQVEGQGELPDPNTENSVKIPLTDDIAQENKTIELKARPETDLEKPQKKLQQRAMSALEKIFSREKLQSGTKRTIAFSLVFTVLLGTSIANFHRDKSGMDTKTTSAIELLQRNLSPGMTESSMQGFMEALTESVTAPPEINRNLIIEDESFVHPGNEISIGDILTCIDRLTRNTFQEGVNPNLKMVEKYSNTAKLLFSAKKLWPQAVKYKVVGHGNNLSIEPVDWKEHIEVKHNLNADIVIAGGELESVTTAIEAAKHSQNVVLVYNGVLGGLSSDTGGNMRYFDSTRGTRTSSQQEVMHGALGMTEDNFSSLPDNVSIKLSNYLKEHYPNIHLVHTKTLNSTHLEFDDEAIKSITTEEGVKVSAKNFIDTDPESRITGKSKEVSASVETPNLSYGMVFDVKGITSQDYEKLRSKNTLTPTEIFKLAGISHDQAVKSEAVRKQLTQLKKDFSASTKHYAHGSWGYRSLASGYNLYMACLSTKDLHDKALMQLNADRDASGFNVAEREGSGTFNSISYNFLESQSAILQNDHDLYKDKDARFAMIREVEIPHLEKFIQAVTGNKELKVIMPHQLYVRRASVAYKPIKNLHFNDFKHHETNMWGVYPNDIRGGRMLSPGMKDAHDLSTERVFTIQNQIHEAVFDINPETAITGPNLLTIGKCNGANPDFMGAIRIIQNSMTMGVAAVDSISKEKIREAYQNYQKKVLVAKQSQQKKGYEVSFLPSGGTLVVDTDGESINLYLPEDKKNLFPKPASKTA